MEIVVDTSVLIAVIANEPEKSLLVEHTEGTELLAPSSVHWEIGNAFSAMLKRKRVTIGQIVQALNVYHSIPVRFIDIELTEAIQLAAQLNVYAYDAYVLTCARNQNCPLLSLDSGLIYAAKQAKIQVLEV